MNMIRTTSFFVRCGLTGVVAAAVSISAMATEVPFTEDFDNDSANWFNSAGTAPLDFVPSGGPDGGSFAAGTFNFVSSAPNDTPAMFRAQDEFGSSGGAFEGDWITDGVTELSYWVRQDTGVPLTFFTRFAGPANTPGANSINFIPVPSGVWTQITVPIPDPDFIFEGPFTFEDVFSNIGHLQPGIVVPDDLAFLDETFTFGIDKVAIVPEPATCVLLASGVLAGAWRTRRRRRGPGARRNRPLTTESARPMTEDRP